MIALQVLKCTPCQGQLNKKVYFIKKIILYDYVKEE